MGGVNNPGDFIHDLCEKKIFNRKIVDQGRCNCCWAITAALTSSALYNSSQRTEKTRIEGAPQEIINCYPEWRPPKSGKEPDAMGCYTSTVNNAFQYIKEFGLALERDYTFRGRRGDCGRHQLPKSRRLWISGYETVIAKTEGAIDKTEEEILEVLETRPIAAALVVTPQLMMFTGKGIFDGNFLSEEDRMEAEKRFTKIGQDDEDEYYHAVTIVGYGVENGIEYYKIKNTWGEGWGDNGYARVRRDLFPLKYMSWPTGAHIRG